MIIAADAPKIDFIEIRPLNVQHTKCSVDYRYMYLNQKFLTFRARFSDVEIDLFFHMFKVMTVNSQLS